MAEVHKTPFISISRHRIQTDGDGVTTLCGFFGCPLRCKYCINPHSFSDTTKVIKLTPQELYERVKIDDLYFVATNGGVTFGGGEPLLYPEFISEFRTICGDRWRICAETSLNVSRESVEIAASVVDHFFVDIKDTDEAIYKSYTGKSNDIVLENLKYLVSHIKPERITARIPLIKGYNNEENRIKSVELLKKFGIKKFDMFEYIIKSK